MKAFGKRGAFWIILLLQIIMATVGVTRCVFKENRVWNYDKMIDWTNSIPLERGSYFITVSYLAVEDGVTIQAFMDTSHGQNCADVIPLDQSQQEKTFELYVSETTEHFFMQTETTNDDETKMAEDVQREDVSIHSITIEETNRMERMQAFLLIFLFLCIDAAYVMKKRIRSALSEENRTVVFGLLVIVILSSVPLFVDYMISGHDIYFHLMRIEGIAKGLSDGQFPVRMQTEWMNGYGYPIGVMYGDIFLYLPAMLRILGFPLQCAYKIYVLLINVVTVVSAYGFAKELTGSKKMGLFGSLLYTLGAYRMINLYFRSAVGEYTAMAFMPLVFWGFHLLFHDKTKQKKGIICLVIGYTAILQSHLLSFEMILLFSGLYCALQWKELWKNIWTLVKTAVYTVLLNLNFLVPFVHYMVTINLKVKTEKTYDMQEQGLFPSQIFGMFKWGGSGSGELSRGMSVDMPLTQGIAMLLLLVLFAWEVFAYGKRLKEQNEKTVWHEQCISAILMLLALGMSCWFFPWKAIENIPLVGNYLTPYQFAWRFLAVVSVMGLFLAGYAVGNLHSIIGKDGQITVIAVMCVLTLIQSTYFTDTILADTEPERITSAACIDTVGAVTGGEYLMEEMQKTMTYSTDIENPDAVIIGDSGRDGRYYFIECVNSSEYGTYVIAPIWNYKRYMAVDQETDQEMQVISDSFGRVEVLLPGNYKGTVKIWFSEPRIWRIAETISAFMLLWGVMWLRKKAYRRLS